MTQQGPLMKYIVITPVRNEAEYIERTLESMIKQTTTPSEWIIVNDGSTDETAEIVTQYAARYPWIKLVNKDDRGNRQRGKGVIETFYFGQRSLSVVDYDVIVKLDGDVSFEPNYFESLMREFVANPSLGITGGGVYERLSGQTWRLQATRDHVRGPTKVYRRACFEEIGGLLPVLGWDGVDEWQALTHGWRVRSFLDLEVYHYRATGAATGRLKSRIEQGYGAYFIGYHPLFIIARALRHAFSRPYIIGGLAMIAAYLAAWLGGRQPVPDPAVVRFVRRTQLRQLLGLLTGKSVHETKPRAHKPHLH
jgi:poly-beta-1,6-N-acetyl-D-glucosamine synthase